MGLRGPKARPVAARFAERLVRTDSGCIEWRGGTNGVGYGVLRLGPEDGSRKIYAHRFSYEESVGPIPDGMQLDHLCRNTLCVNPAHLEPVTLAENVRRGVSSPARNARKTHCPNAHPYSGDNLRIGSQGNRICVTCSRERDRLRRPRTRTRTKKKAS